MNIYEKTTTTYVPEFSKEDIEFICGMYEFLWTKDNMPKNIVHHMVTWGLQYAGFAKALTIINLLGSRQFYKIASDYELRDCLMTNMEEYANKCTDLDLANKAIDMLRELRKVWKR